MTNNPGIKWVPVEVTVHDLTWMANTIHQAHHAQTATHDNFWSTCKMPICEYVQKLLDQHDRKQHEAMGCTHPLPCPNHGLRITHTRPHDKGR